MRFQKVVQNIKAINQFVSEINFDDCVFQIYAPFFNVDINDVVEIQVSSALLDSGEYRVCATVYHVVDKTIFLSSGGLLARISAPHHQFQKGEEVYCTFTRRRSKRKHRIT